MVPCIMVSTFLFLFSLFTNNYFACTQSPKQIGELFNVDILVFISYTKRPAVSNPSSLIQFSGLNMLRV